MSQFTKNLAIWLLIAFVLITAFNMFSQVPTAGTMLPYSEFIKQVNAGAISSAEIQGRKIVGTTRQGSKYQTYAPADLELVPLLIKNNVLVKALPPEESPWYITVLVSWFPMLLLIGVWIFFMRQMQGGSGKAMSFGRSVERVMKK
ncbi:MAG: ATP-dependent metallopeptidase FtsH/Yme1/Tma family protein [Desulfovibrionaceae bacterium]|nr:ATP-dependent metallopeptidase FtsH/Yme1/Tma family protein [Desulfovibrionaceae bacterium]